jgi:hypothetical protein
MAIGRLRCRSTMTGRPPATTAKGIARQPHSHQRNHRPGPTRAERSLKAQDNSRRFSSGRCRLRG